MPGSSGTLTVPADKDDEWADYLWLEAFGRFDAWIDGVMSELRAGLQSAPDDDVRRRVGKTAVTRYTRLRCPRSGATPAGWLRIFCGSPGRG
jgi:hypothetical protein